MRSPIFFFTDFRWDGPYVGQMHGAALAANPDAHLVDLMHDAPSRDPKLSAYLLAALLRDLPEGATVVGVVDPGVGSAREALMVDVDGKRLVGPDNGLFEIAMRQAMHVERTALQWRPERLSASFHGRDLFAPAAARWAAGHRPACTPLPAFPENRPGATWPDDLAQVIYIDGYGNAMTGIRAAVLPDPVRLTLSDGSAPPRARTFSDVPERFGFWYENSIGLAEIAVNGGSAAQKYGLRAGSVVDV
ncbi:SAM-dependent chlorinase/fluorinase [Rhodospirillaceae bacterium KN72]|uniref:SAM-dependent chlorinase/fluorinase n=1 Tax=Pacificispira spongiicola TaxID=2729598 RepID=A0A7Y0E183_9PROT|nr:SAM-dependent chlorinase/fluorinase [Pacificispira spongiicola]NMM45379.1 SAM-dependent chlorinase/fluorinase [Pacificispira spongiicola]